MMNPSDVIDIETLKKFVSIKGKNSPYSFFGKNKKILDNIKSMYGYPQSASINEILFYEEHKGENFLCLNCGKNLKYNTKKDLMPKYCSSVCCSIYNKDTISIKRKNTMAKLMQDDVWASEYKDKISKKSKEYHNSDEGKYNNKIHSEEMRRRILSGEFTPNITNSWTRWKTEYNGKKFRSMYECLFYAYHLEINSAIKYEFLRIPYTYEGKNRTYITDFVDDELKIVYEIKPKILIDTPINLAKFSALTTWAINNEYSIIYVTEDLLNQYLINLTDCDFKNKFYEKYPKWKK